MLGANLRTDTLNLFRFHQWRFDCSRNLQFANSTIPLKRQQKKSRTDKVGGVFGGITLTYKEMLILDATARNDKSSTLPEGIILISIHQFQAVLFSLN